MTLFHDDILDDGLNAVTDNGNALHILSADPELTWANIATYTLGNKISPTIGAPEDRTGGGRKITVSQITDGTVTAAGTGTHYALVDTGNTKILVSGAIMAPRVIVLGDTLVTSAFDIGIPANQA